MYDVAIIGCGVTGAACAYTLSKYDVSVLVLERENDVAMGATRANSAVFHAGFDPEPGTLMAKLNVRGAELGRKICQELDVLYKMNGALVLSFGEQDDRTLRTLMDRGTKNGVRDLGLLDRGQTLRLEPNLSPQVTGALYAPTSAITDPWDLALAMAETAVLNGADVRLNSGVSSIERGDGGYVLYTSSGRYEARFIVSAAGVDCVNVHDMICEHDYDVRPTRGEYFLFDKSEGRMVSSTVFQTPGAKGKGVLVLPTVHGNLLAGPNAVLSDEPHRVGTTPAGMEEVRAGALRSVPGLNFGKVIRTFAGMRANTDRGDFMIRVAAPGFIEAGGIKSPGLTAAPAVAEMVAELLGEAGLTLREKGVFVPRGKKTRIAGMSPEEISRAAAVDPLYARVICRCETITEGEIMDAIRSPIPPASVDAMKRRAGTGMGRCQGGFCGPRVLDILSRATGRDALDIPKDGAGSYILTGRTKSGR